jgi:hypothetical protein
MILVRILKPEALKRGSVELTVYKVYSEQKVEGREFLDVVAEYSERYKNSRDTLVIVSRVDDKGNVVEEAAIYNGNGLLLFPSPAQLKRIIVVRSIGDGRQLRDEYEISELYYVYMGEIKVSDAVSAVILVTDKGARPIAFVKG